MRTISVIVVGALVAVLAIAIALVYVGSRSTDAAKVGACLRVVQTSPAKLKRVDCDDQRFNYIVAATVPNGAACPTKAYGYVDQDGGGRLCLAPSYRQGKCYLLDQNGEYTKISDVDCDATTADEQHIVKVVARVNSADVPNCSLADAEVSVSYTQPAPLGYCLKMQGESGMTDPFGPDGPYGSGGTDPDAPDPGMSGSPTTAGGSSLPTI